ncbi:ATP-dependent helicase [Alkalilimnicola ehrlichii MLHE-1]|uniref:DNA 3'-5' helicase n=1 Tax=Alkalilimnicola ehrlichii (strain ATCC BAA-1101 / DSM 17681 / MLHE-1) TaxID=187272 RepID=Q0A7Z8_ALKEH|nr:ATP-dependent helicase [Alkalilimnicola ehrlichii]ABI57039.1 UvrD/REP helicase [Alkalilimnicola ehrlichii MLHE-1]
MLDQDQARVVAHEDGPAAVLAGAGSGKTRCTTERAARRLTERGLPGSAMVLLTFTNKAAGEMRERLAARLPKGVDLPWIGTFHSFGSRLLREHGQRIGVPGNATLMDAEDSRRMLDALLAGPFPDRTRRQRAMEAQDALAAAGLDPTEPDHLAPMRDALEAMGFGPGATARLVQRLRRYDAEKRRAAIMDFADLILLPSRLLRQAPDLRARLREQLRDITVDEAQDTDGAQFHLLSLLIPENRTVVLVGDDDQAIYEWRHARPANLRRFIEEQQARVYRLERNYRSTPPIVDGAVSLVRHNRQRLEKRPWAVRGPEQAAPVTLVRHTRAEEMAEAVVQDIRSRLRAGLSADEVAVLYRKNRLARPLEGALLRHGIPYRVKAGMDLLGHADVRMMLAAGRLAANRRDVRALSRLADLIPGLGARGVSRLISSAGDPLTAAGQLPPQAAQAVERLRQALDNLFRLGPQALSQWCLQTPVFAEWLNHRARAALKRDGSRAAPEALDRALKPARARLGAVQRAINRRLAALDRESAPAQRWTNALEIAASASDDSSGEDACVTLCSVHGAKGLEWPEVHVFGFTEGLMPLARDGRVDNLEEERRLAYVAITRGQDRVVLHHADRIDRGDGQGVGAAALSPFLEELQTGPEVAVIDNRAAVREASEVLGGEPPTSPEDWLAAMRRQVR